MRTRSISPPLRRRRVMVALDETPLKAHPAVGPKDSAGFLATPPFLDATIKKTWAYGYARHEDVTIEEVLQRDDLTLAVISAFQWNLDWLFSKLDIDSTDLLLIMGVKGESLKQQCQEEASRMPRLRLCFAPMDTAVQIMHSKMMLLFHPTYLRIVVTTANLVPHDWGETGVMENMVFLIDLPRIEKPREQTTFFQTNLMGYLDAVGLDQSLRQSLVNFDFSRTRDLAFVHSIGGVHTGEEMGRTGFCGLGLAIRELGLEVLDGSPVTVDYVTSSLGSAHLDFLQNLYMACQGDDGLTQHRWKQNIITKSGELLDRWAELEAARLVSMDIYAKMRIYYPVHQTVEKSRGGTASGGTLCFNGDFENYTYQVKEMMRDCWSRRSGLLMHNKLIYVRRLGNLASPGWAYIGSANCSQSAWGKMTKGKEGLGLPKLTCRNWECGVVIPIRRARAISMSEGERIHKIDRESEGVVDMSIFDGIIPIPMRMPGARYMGRKPWGQHRRDNR